MEIRAGELEIIQVKGNKKKCMREMQNHEKCIEGREEHKLRKSD